MKLTDRLMNKNNLSDKLLSVICGMSMSPSVILLQMNLLTDKACKKKKKELYSLHSIGISIVEYNMSLIEKLYIISSVIFFVRR
jgi:predicted transcriptional regulator